ncbi:hypothetical protein B0H14DRAFT_2607917 [Mycena olivaceomarginata]|nr:hypothetical protein B0H14DRAFT_2607917 [Mycena olivaceomarginata]
MRFHSDRAELLAEKALEEVWAVPSWGATKKDAKETLPFERMLNGDREDPIILNDSTKYKQLVSNALKIKTHPAAKIIVEPKAGTSFTVHSGLILTSQAPTSADKENEDKTKGKKGGKKTKVSYFIAREYTASHNHKVPNARDILHGNVALNNKIAAIRKDGSTQEVVHWIYENGGTNCFQQEVFGYHQNHILTFYLRATLPHRRELLMSEPKARTKFSCFGTFSKNCNLCFWTIFVPNVVTRLPTVQARAKTQQGHPAADWYKVRRRNVGGDRERERERERRRECEGERLRLHKLGQEMSEWSKMNRNETQQGQGAEGM